jgi:hypothetical protein
MKIYARAMPICSLIALAGLTSCKPPTTAPVEQKQVVSEQSVETRHPADHPRKTTTSPTNLLNNSGFELGAIGLGMGTLAGPWARLDVTAGSAWEGKKSLRVSILPEYATAGAGKYEGGVDGIQHARWVLVETDYVRVVPGKPYVFSAYVRGEENGNQVFLVLRTAGSSHTTTVSGKAVKLTSDWQRISVVLPETAKYPFPAVIAAFGVNAESLSPAKIWFDGAQLEEGTQPTPYQPKAGLDLGVTTEKPNNIFDVGEPVKMIASVSAGPETGQAGTLDYTVAAWDGREMKRGQIGFRLMAGETMQERIDLGVLPPGYYLGNFKYGEGKGRILRIAVIKKRTLPLDRSVNPGSFFGLHWRPNAPDTDAALAEAGARWMKVYQGFDSPSHRDRVLRADGDWGKRWGESCWEKAVSRRLGLDTYIGFNILPVWIPGVSDRIAAFTGLEQAQPQNPVDFEKATRLLIEDTKDWNKYVESFNEVYGYLPIKEGADVSAHMDYFKLFHESAKKADASVNVMHNVVYDRASIHELLEPCMAKGLAKYMDVLAFHFYGVTATDPERLFESYVGEIKAVMKKHNAESIPLWMTEGGGGSWPSDEDPYRDPALAGLWARRGNGEIAAARWMVRMHLSGLAEGVQKFFYFMAADWQRNACGLLRDDGCPRPTYVGYAAMTEMLEGSKFVEKVVLLDEGVRFYVFERADAAVVVFTKGINGISGKVGFPAEKAFAEARLFDLMGAPLDADRNGQRELESVFDDTPRYLVLPGVSGATAIEGLKKVSLQDVKRGNKVYGQPEPPRGTTFLIEAENPVEVEGHFYKYGPYCSGGKGWGYTGFGLKDYPNGFRAKYAFEVIGGGDYGIWIASNPPGGFGGEDSWASPVEFRIDDGEWREVKTDSVGKKYSASGPDSKTKEIWWLRQGPLPLKAGRHTLELRVTQPRRFKVDTKPMYVFFVDAIAIATETK